MVNRAVGELKTDVELVVFIFLFSVGVFTSSYYIFPVLFGFQFRSISLCSYSVFILLGLLFS